MRSLLIPTLIFTSLFSLSSFAALNNHKPARCPSASSLQHGSFDMVSCSFTNNTCYLSKESNRYDTNDDWTFVIRAALENDTQTAINKANEEIKTLSFMGGPAYSSESGGYWLCLYTGPNDVEAYAVHMNNASFNKPNLKKLFR